MKKILLLTALLCLCPVLALAEGIGIRAPIRDAGGLPDGDGDTLPDNLSLRVEIPMACAENDATVSVDTPHSQDARVEGFNLDAVGEEFSCWVRAPMDVDNSQPVIFTFPGWAVNEANFVGDCAGAGDSNDVGLGFDAWINDPGVDTQDDMESTSVQVITSDTDYVDIDCNSPVWDIDELREHTTQFTSALLEEGDFVHVHIQRIADNTDLVDWFVPRHPVAEFRVKY